MAREKTTTNLPAVTVTALGRATRAKSDEQLLDSWLANLTSGLDQQGVAQLSLVQERAKPFAASLRVANSIKLT